MAKTINLKILPDGRVQAVVEGVKGKACMNYIGILEEILDAEAVASCHTAEYHQTEQVMLEQIEDSPLWEKQNL